MYQNDKYKPLIILYEGFLNSYSQIFFSGRKLLAVLILLITFFNTNTGISGVVGVLSALITAYIMGFNRFNIASGYYSFNVLLVSLGIGFYYKFGIELFVILYFASFLTLMLTLAMEGVIGKYRVPYLSIPFLIGLWMVTLATRQFTSLSLSETEIYVLNEMYAVGGTGLLRLYAWFDNLPLHQGVIVYFKSLGAIFFQYNVLAGIVLAIGLLIYSRQAFILSVLGFASAYFYYGFIGASINELYYTYIGFNFILTAIAVGGFFIIPSIYSYLFVILLTPVTSILLASTATVFSVYQLSVYSLPFNIVVILFLYILKFRESRLNIPEVVALPRSSPEENLYHQRNAKSRFSHLIYLPLELPVRGEWRVSQAHNGDITHRDKWRHAWDFDIVDDRGKTYRGDGLLLDDYYCYNKPVLAPADGTIESIIYDVGDNEIGDVNTENNWGNTIIIKHAPFLYSKLSHLRAGTFKVQQGELVKKGQVLAHTGNSGRSPEPHLHFQFQATPHIGSDTLDYPLAHYVVRQINTNKLDVKSFDRPLKDELVQNLQKEALVADALHFVPGQKIKYKVLYADNTESVTEWEVITDIYNTTYIYCKETRSKAFVYNDGKIHYFTGFEGSRKSLLYNFYLGAYKLLTGFYKGLEMHDIYPLHKLTRNNILLWVQDCVSPFYIFIDCPYHCYHTRSETSIDLESVTLKTTADVKVFGKSIRRKEFELFIEENRIKTFTIIEKNRKIKATCIED